jgi:hypothetical protein
MTAFCCSGRIVFELARRYGVRIEYADLGVWGEAELRSEYDPQGPVIRLNTRIIEKLPSKTVEAFIAFAIAHELYHHREYCGEVPYHCERAARERAANRFAQDLLAESNR